MYSQIGNNITLSRGDTMELTIRSGFAGWNAVDRAMFTVKNGAGTVVLQEIHQMDANGDFTVAFHNQTTDSWPVGTYTYDVRYVVSPSYDDAGNIVDGIDVITPAMPANITIMSTVGEV